MEGITVTNYVPSEVSQFPSSSKHSRHTKKLNSVNIS